MHNARAHIPEVFTSLSCARGDHSDATETWALLLARRNRAQQGLGGPLVVTNQSVWCGGRRGEFFDSSNCG